MALEKASSIAKALRKVIAKLKTIPSGIATQTHVGWMATGDKIIVDQHGQRAAGTDTSANIDILALDFGYYAGRNFVNAPLDADKSLVLVRVAGYPGYKHLEYNQVSSGYIWYRDIYSTDWDTGWVSTKWVEITPINGCTGEMVVRKLPGLTFTNIELRMNLTCSITSTGVVQIGTLPSGYTTLDTNQVHFVVNGTINGGSIPLGLYITQGNVINIFRVDGGTSGPAIQSIRGNIQFSRLETKGAF